MKLDWLSTFLDVSETHNFNRTAERLRITQSTVSSRIRALEEELDMQLFVRGRGGASLTPEGKKFLKYANSIRISWNQALKDMRSSHDFNGKVYISTQMSIWEQLTNEWLAGIRQALPNIAIHVEADYSKNMIDELLSGHLDIAVLYAPDYEPSFEIEHLFDESFVMLATEPMHISKVNRDNYVFVGLTEYFEDKHGELLPHLQPAALTMGLSIMSLEYLKKNGGAAYVSQRHAKRMIENQELYVVDDAPVIKQPVFVTYLSKNRHNLVIREVLKVLHNIMAST